MQKMSDDLFKMKTKEKSEEEKNGAAGSKNPNGSNAPNAYHKINEMDLFGEINQKDEQKTQSRNNTSQTKSQANQNLDILDDAFAMDDLFGLDDSSDSSNPNTSEIVDRGEEVCFSPDISSQVEEASFSQSEDFSPDPSQKVNISKKDTSASQKDFKKNAKTLLDSLYINQGNSDDPHKTHESQEASFNQEPSSQSEIPKEDFSPGSSQITTRDKEVCSSLDHKSEANFSPDPSPKKQKKDEKGKTPLYSPKEDTPLAKGYDIPKKEEKSKEKSKDKSEEKKHSPDVSMKTRASSIGDYIDKIKEKIATESPGEKLNSTKEENGDNVTIEDKIYAGLETGCNVALDMMEGAGENLAFRLKRGATSIFSSFQNKMLKKKFKRNDNIIQYGDFMFYEMEEELMLYRYVGVDTEIKIPSYVEGMPVSYLEKNFLRFNAIKSIGRGLSIDRIQDISMESIQDNLFNIKSVQLPSTLKILPAKVFSGCKRIDELVIPESVTLVQPNAFVGCRPTRIIFLGEAPKQLQDSNLAKVHIYCKQEHFDSFFKLMRNYDDYIANKTIKEKYLRLRNKILNSKDTSKWERMRRATDISDEALV